MLPPTISLEQDPVLTLVSTCDFSTILGMQQASYLTEVAHMSQLFRTIITLIQTSLFRAQKCPTFFHTPISQLELPVPGDAGLEGNEEDVEAVLEKAAEDFSPPHCHCIEEVTSTQPGIIKIDSPPSHHAPLDKRPRKTFKAFLVHE